MPTTGRAGLQGQVHDLDDLLAEDLAERSAEHREVLGEHEHLAAVDGAVAGDDAVAVRAFALDPEAVRAVAGECVELDERARVEEGLDPLAGGHLAARVLRVDRLARSRRAPPRRPCAQLGELAGGRVQVDALRTSRLVVGLGSHRSSGGRVQCGKPSGRPGHRLARTGGSGDPRLKSPKGWPMMRRGPGRRACVVGFRCTEPRVLGVERCVEVVAEGPEATTAATLDDVERRALAEDRLRALTAIGRAVTRGDSADALSRIVEAAMVALGAASSSLGVWDETAQVLRTRLNLGELADWEEPFPTDEWYVADQSTWLAGMDSGHLGMIVRLDDPTIAADDRYYLERLDKFCSMSVPILRDGEWWGELFVARRADQPPFTERDLEWGTAVAAQVGAAVEALDHLDRVARLAHTDVLTGLANRLTMEEWMRSAIERHKLDGDDVAFVVCDLNGLHEINSDQGHDAGDRALKQFARLLRQATTPVPGVLAARFGGDEFCLAVVGEDADRLVAIAADVTRRGWDMLPVRRGLRGRQHQGPDRSRRECRTPVPAGRRRAVPCQAHGLAGAGHRRPRAARRGCRAAEGAARYPGHRPTAPAGP